MQDLKSKGNIILPDASLMYEPAFLEPEEADTLYDSLLREVLWQQDEITLFGKTFPQPRLTALYGENGKSYAYSGIRMQPHPFPEILKSVKSRVEAYCGHFFTTCLLNLYRDGTDSNGWHADDEKELGVNPVIASVSLGAPRAFHLKHRKEASERYRLVLDHGSLLVMGGPMQHHWLHQLPKTRRPIGGRINMTFRNIA